MLNTCFTEPMRRSHLSHRVIISSVSIQLLLYHLSKLSIPVKLTENTT